MTLPPTPPITASMKRALPAGIAARDSTKPAVVTGASTNNAEPTSATNINATKILISRSNDA